MRRREFLLDFWLQKAGLSDEHLKAIERVCPRHHPTSGHHPFRLRASDILHARELLAPHAKTRTDIWRVMHLADMERVLLADEDYFRLDIADQVEARKNLAQDWGEAIAALFMDAAFSLDWSSLERIPAAGKSAPDFRARGKRGQYVFEAKGTTRKNRLRQMIDHGKLQKQGFASPGGVGCFVIGSFLPARPGPDRAFIEFADPLPPFDPRLAFSPEADKNYMEQHYARAIRFAFGSTRPPKAALGRWGRGRTKFPVVELEAKDRTFVGNEFDLRNEGATLHRHIDERLQETKIVYAVDWELLKAGEHRYDDTPAYAQWDAVETTHDERNHRQTSIFSDGTLLEISP